MASVTSAFGPMVVIADASGRGPNLRRIHEVESELSVRGFEFRSLAAAGPAQVESAVHEAIASGKRYIVVVGDDRTVSHAVNGMIDGDHPVAPDAVLGIVAASDDGCDFIRTFGLPGDVRGAVAHLEGRNVFPIDVGKVTCSSDGERVTRYFPNLAQVGLGGAITRRVDAMPPWLGSGRRFLSFWISVSAFRRAAISLMAGDRHFEGTAHNVYVANGQYYGGGMRISPRSWPGDGLLDVLVMTGPRSDAFTLLPSIYRGEHLPHPHIVELKARSLTLETERPWPVEADGTPLGRTPARFEVIRQPIRLKI